MSNTQMNGQAGEISHTEPPQAAGAAPVKRKRKSPVKRPPAHPPVSSLLALEFWNWSKPKIVGWFSAAIMTLIAGGWIMLPAKQADLDAVKVEMRAGFGSINQKFQEIGSQFAGVRESYEAIHSELVRLRTAQEVRQATVAPSAPLAPRRPRRAPAPPDPAKATNIFGF